MTIVDERRAELISALNISNLSHFAIYQISDAIEQLIDAKIAEREQWLKDLQNESEI